MSNLRFGKVSLAEVLRLSHEAREVELRVSMPATIESFDPVTQLARVRPCLREAVVTEEGTEQAVDLPVISDVPCQFPGGGGFSITFPVDRGDPCLLVFSDRSLDKWIDSGDVVDPVDLRRHHLTDAVAILGVRPKPGAIVNFDGQHLTLGKDGQPADFVALAAKVLAEIDTLRTAFLGHGHNVATAGTAAAQVGTTSTPCSPALETATPTPPLVPANDVTCPPVNSVASTTVKVKG